MEKIKHRQKCRGRQIVEYIAPATERDKVLQRVHNNGEELYSESYYMNGDVMMVQIFSTKLLKSIDKCIHS